MSNKPPVKWQIYTAADPTVLRIIPELAAEIGLNESIVLMQIAFWIKTSNNVRDGIYWTYQSMAEMKEKAFPYWSVDTIRRIIHKLETDGYIVIGQHNKRKGDNTQWYALEPDKLSSLTSVIVGPVEKETSTPYSQDASMPSLQVASTPLQYRTTLPEITTESKEKDSAPNGTEKSAVRERNPWYDAVYSVWGYTASLNALLSQMLQGKATRKGYKEYNLETPITPEQLTEWAAWYRRVKLSNNPKLSMVAEHAKIQSSIGEWLLLNHEPSGKLLYLDPPTETDTTDSGDFRVYDDSGAYLGKGAAGLARKAELEAQRAQGESA